MNKSAYTVFMKNEEGYTFASLLLTLMIVIITLPVIGLLLQSMVMDAEDRQVDALQFFEFLHADALVARKVEVNQRGNILYFYTEDRKVKGKEVRASVEKYGNLIRRRVDGEGHEIYLRQVETFHVTPVSYGFQVRLTMKGGEMYEKTIKHATRAE